MNKHQAPQFSCGVFRRLDIGLGHYFLPSKLYLFLRSIVNLFFSCRAFNIASFLPAYTSFGDTFLSASCGVALYFAIALSMAFLGSFVIKLQGFV